MSQSSSPEAAIAYQNLEQRLPLVKPYLFQLADNVIAAAPDARWNVLIGDDVSGRLTTFFMRRVLGYSGVEIPTHFVAGSKRLHDHLPESAYKERFSSIAQNIGAHTLRPLIVTESIGTRATLDFLEDKLAPFSKTIESACLVSKTPQLCATYNGGFGEEASRAVFFTFESNLMATSKRRAIATMRRYIPQFIKDRTPMDVKQIGSWPSNDLLSLHIDKTAVRPICQRSSNNPFTTLAYQLIENAAIEYSHAAQPEFETNGLWRR